MNRRLVPLATAAAVLAVLAVAAVPALGDDEVAPSFDRRASAGALAKAKRALGLARGAHRAARRASRVALGADGRAAHARAHANAAKALAEEDRSQVASLRSQLEALKEKVAANEGVARPIDGIGERSPVISASEADLVSTNSPSGEFEALGGPRVQAIVPGSGLIEVWAQVAIDDDEGGAVGLFEDGEEVEGVSEPELCGDDSALIDAAGEGPGEFVLFATPPVPGLLGCASGGAPAPVLLSRSPGLHTYELRYAQCSCGGAPARFKDRTLRVAPRP